MEGNRSQTNIVNWLNCVELELSNQVYKLFITAVKILYSRRERIRQTQIRGVFRTFELRVLTVIDCPKIASAKGLTAIDFPILRVLKHP